MVRHAGGWSAGDRPGVRVGHGDGVRVGEVFGVQFKQALTVGAQLLHGRRFTPAELAIRRARPDEMGNLAEGVAAGELDEDITDDLHSCH